MVWPETARGSNDQHYWWDIALDEPDRDDRGIVSADDPARRGPDAWNVCDVGAT
jgi:hypothetical protein